MSTHHPLHAVYTRWQCLLGYSTLHDCKPGGWTYNNHTNLIESGMHTLSGVTGQNGSGQTGMDKMVWTKWYTDKMALDKMVWTKWYGHNGTDIMVPIFGIDYNSSEFNTYL